MFIDQCNLCSYKVTQVVDFLRNNEIQETECLSTSVICVHIKLLKWWTF